MKTESEKDKHVTFRAPDDLIEQVRQYCSANDETFSQFWRKAAKARLEKLEEMKRPQSSSAPVDAPAVRSGGKDKGRVCHDEKHCRKVKTS